MSNSFLSFTSSSSFRNSLMGKNLAPYNVQGVYSPQVSNLTYETILGDSQVIDSPNNLIAEDPYVKILYPLNTKIMTTLNSQLMKRNITVQNMLR